MQHLDHCLLKMKAASSRKTVTRDLYFKLVFKKTSYMLSFQLLVY